MAKTQSEEDLIFGSTSSNRRHRLRYARYWSLAESIASYIRERPATDRPGLDLLDAGLGYGRTLWLLAAFIKLSRREYRGHLFTYSLKSMRQTLLDTGRFDVLSAKGFRIVSGGILSPLEQYRWWWNFSHRLGRLFPSWCAEVQFTATKREPACGRHSDSKGR